MLMIVQIFLVKSWYCKSAIMLKNFLEVLVAGNFTSPSVFSVHIWACLFWCHFQPYHFFFGKVAKKCLRLVCCQIWSIHKKSCQNLFWQYCHLAKILELLKLGKVYFGYKLNRPYDFGHTVISWWEGLPTSYNWSGCWNTTCFAVPMTSIKAIHFLCH